MAPLFVYLFAVIKNSHSLLTDKKKIRIRNMATTYEHIKRNKIRSAVLVLLFPVSFIVFIYLSIMFLFFVGAVFNYFHPTSYLTFGSTLFVFHQKAMHICSFALPISFLIGAFWARIALKEGDKILLNRIGGVRYLHYFEAEELHRLVENLCMTIGLPKPNLYELEDESLNAFSVGVRPEESSIVLSQGLLEKLNRVQLEGVLAQQLAHIRLYDVRMMSMIIMLLAFFTFAGEYLVYGTERKNISSWKDLPSTALTAPRIPGLSYIGLVLLGYGYLIAPLIRLSLSRHYQLTADAEAALMTRYPRGLAQALWYISADSRLEALDYTELLGVLCIENPHKKESVFNRLSGLWQSHPPIEDRIRALNDMDGLFLHIPEKTR